MCEVQSGEASREQVGVYLSGSRWVVNAVQVGMRQAGLSSGTLLSWHLQQGPAPRQWHHIQLSVAELISDQYYAPYWKSSKGKND